MVVQSSTVVRKSAVKLFLRSVWNNLLESLVSLSANVMDSSLLLMIQRFSVQMVMVNHSLFSVNSSSKTQTLVFNKLKLKSLLRINSLLLKQRLLQQQFQQRKKKVKLVMKHHYLRKVWLLPTSIWLLITLPAHVTKPFVLSVSPTMTWLTLWWNSQSENMLIFALTLCSNNSLIQFSIEFSNDG